MLTFGGSVGWWFESQRNLPQLTGLFGTGSSVKLDRVIGVVGVGVVVGLVEVAGQSCRHRWCRSQQSL